MKQIKDVKEGEKKHIGSGGFWFNFVESSNQMHSKSKKKKKKKAHPSWFHVNHGSYINKWM